MNDAASDWAPALTLYGQALDLPADDRLAWARAQAVPDGVALVLARLLDDRERIETGSFLVHGPALAPGAMAPGAADADAVGALPLARVGPYRLIRELGHGGMSTVYLAERDDEQLRRQVALKLPHAGPGQAALAQRLLRERDALVGLSHPHIARLYDVVLTPEGLPCLVLEYIEGLPIDQHCAQRRLGLQARLQLFDQVLRAVQFAHARLVLHRDLKPSNILVDSQGEVKLLDFGIAKMLDGSAEEDSALTRQGGTPMTPDYAAPEQIAGQPLGTACDVYALGVVLYELLTAQRPYRLPRGTRGALEEAILATDPQRPSERWRERPAAEAEPFQASPAALRRLLAGDLDLIVLQALRKQPTQRYITADAFALDLRRWLAREPVAAQPDRWGYRMRRFLQRHALAVGAGALVSLALVVGLGTALWQAQLARDEARRAQAIKDFLVGLFEASSLNQADAARKSRQTVRELLEHSAGALRTGLSQQPALRNELQGLVGHLLSELSLTDSALALRRERVAQLAQRGAPPAEQGQALRELAQTHEQRGETGPQQAALDRAVALLKDRREPEAQAQRWAAEASLGRLALLAAQPGPAQARIEPAAEALGRLAPDTELAAEAWRTLALLRLDQGRQADALAWQARAMALQARLFAGQPARLARERYRHAMALWQGGAELSVVEPELRQAWQGLREAAGAEEVDTALVEQQLGLVQLYLGDERGAQALLLHSRSVLERQAARIDPEHLLQGRLYLVEAHLQAGRFDQAQALLTPVRAGLEAPAQAASLAWQRYADMLQVSVWSEQGDDAAALALLAQWRRRLPPPGPPEAAGRAAPTPDQIDLAQREADVHQAAGRPAQALALLQTLAPQLGDAARRADVQAQQGSLLLDLGRPAEALPLLQSRFEALQVQPAGRRPLLAWASAHHRLARAWMALGQPQRALPLFESALALHAQADEHNTYLAALRAHHAQALAATGKTAAARRQLDLAVLTLKRQPRLAATWWWAVRDTEALLPGPVPRAPGSAAGVG